MKQLLLLLFVLLTLPLLAQQPQLLQERSYKVDGLEKRINTCATNQQGNILYSGTSLVSAYNFKNTFLLVNANADTLWTRNGATGLKLASQALRSTADGGFIYVGTAKNPTISSSNGFLLQKLNAFAIPSWSQTNFFNNIESSPTAMLAMPNNGYLVGGYISSKGYSFLRTDNSGIQQWLKNYTRTSRDVVTDMQFTKNSNIITAGMTAGNLPNTWHRKLLLLNQNGDSLLGKKILFNGLSGNQGMYTNLNSITPLSDGGYLLTSYTDTVNATYPNGMDIGMVFKVDAGLNLQWKYIYRNPATDYYMFTKAKELTDGSILVLGFKFLPTQGGNGFQLYHFSPLGQLLNTYPFTSNICTQVWGVTLDALQDSTYLVGGRCGNNPPITYGFYVAKVKIPGLPLPKPPITITGTSEELAKAGFSLGQSYPNPANKYAIIPFNLPISYKQANILIRDLTGREFGNFVITKNSNSLEVNLRNFSNGLYTYTLLVDEKPVGTKKLSVIR